MPPCLGFAIAALLLLPLPSLAAEDKTLGDKIVAYLEARKGKRVGGGECSQMVVEALRSNGGMFIRNDGTTHDYIWSKTLIVKITGDRNKPIWSVPGATMKPGDIIQYSNTRFKDGKRYDHHTSVVATVDTKGQVTEVYEQNVGKMVDGKPTMLRHILREPLDLSQLVSGHVMIYRPTPRLTKAGRFEFSVVNNTDAPRVCKLTVGTRTLTINLAKGNTSKSYTTWWFSTKTKLKPILMFGTTTLTVDDGQGFEVVTVQGKAILRKLDK